MIRFSYHGYRALLTKEGRRPTSEAECAGLQDLLNAKVNAIGVPSTHNDAYVQYGVNHGMKIVRTLEPPYNYSQGPYNLSKILLDFKNDSALTPANVGQWMFDFVMGIQGPCNGIALDLEINLLDKNIFPTYPADVELAYYWYCGIATEDQILSFRCRQIAVIFRLAIHLLTKFRFPGMDLNIVYSGYDGLLYDRENIRKHYGCDFVWLTKFTSWRWIVLPPISYGMCAWMTSADLPGSATCKKNIGSMPAIIHTIILAPSLDTEENWRAVVRDRIGITKIRPQDEIGHIEYGVRHIWDDYEAGIYRVVADEIKNTT